MAETQAEPFHVAFLTLRERLQEGAFPPGARINAVDVADELRLSTTPVREALSRLAGQGLLEDRRGQGYFVARLSAADVADLYRMSLAALLISQAPHRTSRRSAASPEPDDPQRVLGAVREVETLFRGWAVETGSRALVASFRLLQIQLGPVRRLEPLVFEDLEDEAQRLGAAATSRSERLGMLRQFHGRRIRGAERLAGLLEASAPTPGK